MWGFGRRERARVAARVRALLGGDDSAGVASTDGAGAGWSDVSFHEGGGPLRWTSDAPDGVPEGAPDPVPDDAADDAGDDAADGAPTDGVTPRDRRARVGSHAAPERPRRWRLDPGRPAALAIGIAALFAALLAGWWVLASRPHAVALSGPSGSPVGSVDSAATAAPSVGPGGAGCASASVGGVLVVDVAGKVQRPGVYRLPAGSRVLDAVRAAGGAMPGVSLTSLNLAAPVGDGQQVAVGVPPAAGAQTAGATGSTVTGTGPGALVNLNTATLEQLQTLPGIGPVLGQQIVDWRTEHGGFTALDQLKEVSGIGDTRFAELQPLVTI